MRSHWTLLYEGPYTSIVLKKFERFLQVKALEIERERYVVDTIKLEKRDFFITHETQDWNHLVVEVLQLAGKITSEWILTIGGHERISGLYDPKLNEKKGWESPLDGPSGLYSVFWEIASHQEYRRIRFLGDKKDEW